MITLAILIALVSFLLFAGAVCVICGGIAGLGIVADVTVAIFIICFLIKILINR